MFIFLPPDKAIFCSVKNIFHVSFYGRLASAVSVSLFIGGVHGPVSVTANQIINHPRNLHTPFLKKNLLPLQQRKKRKKKREREYNKLYLTLTELQIFIILTSDHRKAKTFKRRKGIFPRVIHTKFVLTSNKLIYIIIFVSTEHELYLTLGIKVLLLFPSTLKFL